jgi:hypothetical protein
MKYRLPTHVTGINDSPVADVSKALLMCDLSGAG